MAQSPLVIFGGATSDLLKGRQSLQDIDQMAAMKSHCKWMKHVRRCGLNNIIIFFINKNRVKHIVPAVEEAFFQAKSGVPGPVFLEIPADVLYSRKWVEEAHSKVLRGPPGFFTTLVQTGLRVRFNIEQFIAYMDTDLY